MASTVKQVIDEFAARGNFPSYSTYVGNTSATQYLGLLRYIGDFIINKGFNWPQLKRTSLFVTQTNVRNYPLPADFYKVCESTPWDAQNQWPMRGPVSDYNMAIRQLAIVSLQTRKAYQFIGKTNTIFHNRDPNEYSSYSDLYFQIDPPGSDEVDLLQLQYISKNWVLPAAWAPGTTYAEDDVVNVNGQIFSCVTAGDSAAKPAQPPTVQNGISYDGNSVWLCVLFSDWAATTNYSVGQYVKTSGGDYYQCITGGKSGASAPTDSGLVTDGTVTWQSLTVSAWAAETEYAYNDYVTSNSLLFMNLALNAAGSMSVSGKTAPNWSFDSTSGLWQQVDGTATWQEYGNVYSITADTDLVLLDKDIIIDGMNWAFLRARGLDYQDAQATWLSQLQGSAGRFNAPTRINAADEFGDQFGPWPNVPAGSWDV